MSDIGPQLPPYLLARRKRKQEEAAQDEPATASGAKQSTSPGEREKRRRVIGPAMPPAPLDERPQGPPRQLEESDSDDDDGFGPALPSNGADEANAEDPEHNDQNPTTPPAEQKQRRDEWMTMPPKQDDLAARMDPTKQRPRGFNTGRGARAPSALGDDSSAWHETPEQKQKRLADEMMGVAKASSVGPQRPPTNFETRRSEAAAAKTREHTEKTRGPSLLDQHKHSKGREADNDPSQRVFDREKDMASGMRIGHAQKEEMLKKASDFSSKFSSGSYL